MIQNNTRGKKRTRNSKRKLLLQFYNFITLLFVITLFIFYPFSIFFVRIRKLDFFTIGRRDPRVCYLFFFVRMQLPCKLWIIQITGKIMTWRIMILSCHLISFKFFNKITSMKLNWCWFGYPRLGKRFFMEIRHDMSCLGYWR